MIKFTILITRPNGHATGDGMDIVDGSAEELAIAENIAHEALANLERLAQGLRRELANKAPKGTPP